MDIRFGNERASAVELLQEIPNLRRYLFECSTLHILLDAECGVLDWARPDVSEHSVGSFGVVVCELLPGLQPGSANKYSFLLIR
jgi:hypothetical protein